MQNIVKLGKYPVEQLYWNQLARTLLWKFPKYISLYYIDPLCIQLRYFTCRTFLLCFFFLQGDKQLLNWKFSRAMLWLEYAYKDDYIIPPPYNILKIPAYIYNGIVEKVVSI